MPEHPQRILIVDDESTVLSFIASYLEIKKGYTVFTAAHGQEALDFLKTTSVDLVLSDINMPGMKGFTLLSQIKEEYPAIRRVLMTAYNVEEYFELASKHDVGTIFVKTVPFNFNELSTIVSSMLASDFFGAQRYFAISPQQQRFVIKNPKVIQSDLEKVIAAIPFSNVPKKLSLVLVELVTNAVFYGARNADPGNKQEWSYDFELSDTEAVTVDLVWDSQKYAVVVTDSGGKLKKKDVLYWLTRQTTKDESGLATSMWDEHGRGIFIARRFIDRLIINIDPLKKTEIVILMNGNGQISENKPLFINEL